MTEPGALRTLALSESIRSRIVDIVVRAAAPTRIILFGSYARGEQNQYSDLDLVVVEPEVASHYEEMVRLTRALAPLGVPMDVLVYSEAEVKERGDWLGTPLRSALQEGQVLYQAR